MNQRVFPAILLPMKTRFSIRSTSLVLLALAGLLLGTPASRLIAADEAQPDDTAAPAAVDTAAPDAVVSPATEPATPPAAEAAAAVEEPTAQAAPAAAPAPAPAPAPVAAPTPAPAPAPVGPRIDRGDFVTIMNSSHLRANETANQMVTVMGDAIVDGRVSDQSVTVMGNVTVNGYVGNQLVCIMGRVTIGPHAEVHGQIVSVGGDVVAAPGAILVGEKVEIPFMQVTHVPAIRWIIEWVRDGLALGRPLPHQHAWAWIFAAVCLLLNLLLAIVFRRPVDASVAALQRKPAMSLVNGVLTVVLFAPLLIVLLVSVVGILIVPFLLAGMFLATLLGMIAVYRYCGAQFGLADKPLAALAAGNVVFIVVYAVPVLGFAVWTIASLVGLGAVATALIDGMRREARSAAPARVAPAAATTAAVGAGTGPAGAAGLGAVAPGAVAEGASGLAGEMALPPGLPPLPTIPQTADTLPRVGFWPRLGATALDFLLIGALLGFLHVHFLFPYAWLVYHIGFWSWRATTIGGVVLNLRIERLDGSRLDVGVAAVRSLASIFSGMVLGLGFMWASWDDERQSWHDKIAGTTIVRVPRGQSLL